MKIVTITLKAAFEDEQLGVTTPAQIAGRLIDHMLDHELAEVVIDESSLRRVDYPDMSDETQGDIMQLSDAIIERWQARANAELGQPQVSFDDTIRRTRKGPSATKDALRNALNVMVLDPLIRAFLDKYDPKAVEQALRALEAADG